MKHLFSLILGFCLSFFFFLHEYKSQVDTSIIPSYERPLVVVMCSYNNATFAEKSLRSVYEQEYQNYRLIYIDDASKDNNFSIAKKTTEKYQMEERANLIRNDINVGALANHQIALSLCRDEEILIILDGDDTFSTPYVLKKINQIYANPDVWLTYGSYLEIPSHSPGKHSSPIPQKILIKGGARQHRWSSSHLRTYYAGLAKKIRKEDLMYQGNFFKSTGDLAIMLPLLEMAREHAYFISDCLHLYQTENPISDHKKQLSTQIALDKEIRNRSKYSPLVSSPINSST